MNMEHSMEWPFPHWSSPSRISLSNKTIGSSQIWPTCCIIKFFHLLVISQKSKKTATGGSKPAASSSRRWLVIEYYAPLVTVGALQLLEPCWSLAYEDVFNGLWYGWKVKVNCGSKTKTMVFMMTTVLSWLAGWLASWLMETIQSNLFYFSHNFKIKNSIPIPRINITFDLNNFFFEILPKIAIILPFLWYSRKNSNRPQHLLRFSTKSIFDFDWFCQKYWFSTSTFLTSALHTNALPPMNFMK